MENGLKKIETKKNKRSEENSLKKKTSEKTVKTKKTTKKKVIEQIERISGGELRYEGFERKLYCWIRHKRIFCAIHKAIYYRFNETILEDKQYDYIEYSLNAVEKRHNDISDAVTQEGYLSTSDYVDSLADDRIIKEAEHILNKWKANGSIELSIPYVSSSDTDDELYNKALKNIEQYPI